MAVPRNAPGREPNHLRQRHCVGVAIVTTNGDSLTIVSSSEKSDLTFSGSSKDGRLSGQVGFAAGSRVLSRAKLQTAYIPRRKSRSRAKGRRPMALSKGSFSFIQLNNDHPFMTMKKSMAVLLVGLVMFACAITVFKSRAAEGTTFPVKI